MRPECEALKLTTHLTAFPLSPHKLDISALGATTSAGHHGISRAGQGTMTSVIYESPWLVDRRDRNSFALVEGFPEVGEVRAARVYMIVKRELLGGRAYKTTE